MFTIALADERVKPHQTIALHFLIGIALLAFGVLSYIFYFFTITATEAKSSLHEFRQWGAFMIIPGALILIFCLFRGRWLRQPKNNRLFRIIELVSALAFAAYALMSAWWMPAAIFGIFALTLLLALVWESAKSKVQYVRIDDKGIDLPPSSRRRALEWNEVERVLLRFGILTIDCYDNHLYQWNVSAADIDKDSFEAYCNKLVKDNEGKKSNW